MEWVKPLFFLVMGLGLAGVALQGAMTGRLPIGSKGYQQGEGVHRDDSPLLFWLVFAGYFGGGIAIALYALKIF
jgi:hypothetical protein